MKFLLFILCYIIISCANTINVPSEIKVVPEPSEVRVTHSIEINYQLQEIFKNQCIIQASNLHIQENTEEWNTYLNYCINDLSNKFIQDFVAYVNHLNNN